ncbi:MAG: hypothetical protein DME97_03985 [Verrucomicrobia bacterium]|nr:MAG: hypothetical protein DME97_03985 [Verrucomicrobiota bacterium]
MSVASGAEIKSKSTLTLAPLETLTTENALRQGLRIAEIGMSESIAQAADLEKKEKPLKDEIEAFEKKQAEEKAIVSSLDTRFALAQKQYLERLRAYDERRRVHDADAARERTAAAASNSLAPEKRNPATVAQINAWADRVSASKGQLDQEVSLVNQEREVVESKRQAVLSYQEGATQRLEAIHASLEAKVKAHEFKKELAYRQLKQCADYAVEIRKILATKFNDAEVFSPILNGAMEKLKAQSNGGFDTK